MFRKSEEKLIDLYSQISMNKFKDQLIIHFKQDQNTNDLTYTNKMSLNTSTEGKDMFPQQVTFRKQKKLNCCIRKLETTRISASSNGNYRDIIVDQPKINAHRGENFSIVKTISLSFAYDSKQKSKRIKPIRKSDDLQDTKVDAVKPSSLVLAGSGFQQNFVRLNHVNPKNVDFIQLVNRNKCLIKINEQFLAQSQRLQQKLFDYQVQINNLNQTLQNQIKYSEDLEKKVQIIKKQKQLSLQKINQLLYSNEGLVRQSNNLKKKLRQNLIEINAFRCQMSAQSNININRANSTL